MVAALMNDIKNIINYRRILPNARNGILRLDNLGGAGDGSQLREGSSRGLIKQNPALFVAFGVSQVNAQQKPVELVLGKLIRPLKLKRILRGNYHERTVQDERFGIRANLFFGHRLKQGRLCTRGGPVDFVSEDDVRKNRPRLKIECLSVLIEYRHSQHIAGQ